MFRCSALLVLSLLGLSTAEFAPSVTVTCAVGPSYTVDLTDGSATGVIFIDGQCEAQDTAATGSYTFNATVCTTGTVPAPETEFKLVVQEFATINLATDYIVKVTCNIETGAVTQTVTLGAEGEDFDVTDTPTVSPTFTTDFTDDSGNSITNGNVGDSVQIVLSIPAAEAAVFDYQITTLSVAAGTTTVSMITDGCTQFSTIISQPTAPRQPGATTLTLAFDLFIPQDTSASPALPGTTATTVTYTFTIKPCATRCTAPTCGGTDRRRRSADSSNSTVEVEIAASLVIYPPGHKGPTKTATLEKKDDEETSVCLSRTPLIGILVALSVTLAACMGIAIWMFCRLRRSNKKQDMSAFSNSGYKS